MRCATCQFARAHRVVIFTYALSPFSTEALSLLARAGVPYEEITVGAEWFPQLLVRCPHFGASILACIEIIFCNGRQMFLLFLSSNERQTSGQNLATMAVRSLRQASRTSAAEVSPRQGGERAAGGAARAHWPELAAAGPQPHQKSPNSKGTLVCIAIVFTKCSRISLLTRYYHVLP